MDVKLVLEERGRTHGDFTEMARLAQAMKSVIREGSSYEDMSSRKRESLDNILSKIARIVTGNSDFDEHWGDIEGYAKLGGSNGIGTTDNSR